MCEHLKRTPRMDKASHARWRKVWSKLQLVKWFEPDFELCVAIDTDTLVVQSMNDLFWHEAPAAFLARKENLSAGNKARRTSIRHPRRRSPSLAIGRHQRRSSVDAAESC